MRKNGRHAFAYVSISNRTTRMLNRTRLTRSIAVSLALPVILSGCLTEVSTDTAIVAAPVPPPSDNQAPSISGSPPRMAKVGVSYSFAPTASDPDSDSLTFSVQNKPNWAQFDQATGSLSGIPFLGSEGTYAGVAISVSDGSMSAALPEFSVTVEPATAPNMPPEISGTPAVNVTVGNNYLFTPVASDPDGDLLTFTAMNVPSWATFDAVSGSISGAPQVGDENIYANISITVSDGMETASLPAFAIQVNGQNNAPTIAGTPPIQITVGSNYNFVPAASDPDGDILAFSIQNNPPWLTFDATTGELSGVPQMGDVGNYPAILISVTDGSAVAALTEFSIDVNALNSAPSISGTPATLATAGQNYSFIAAASDPDGDMLSFSIQNLPSWLTFSAVTGTLSGTPQTIDVGTHSGIIVSVTDGQALTSLPAFSIEVVAANSAPVISGAPATQITAGASYTFTPVASDVDNDTLVFSVQNAPTWASFDTGTGMLSGTTQAADQGTYTNIVISVSDGSLTTSLPAFTIQVDAVSLGSATLTWTPPTLNEDGSPLTDLTGYVVYYGTAPTVLNLSIPLNNPGLTTYVVDNLAPNTYYFTITAVNSINVESSFSNVASKIIN